MKKATYIRKTLETYFPHPEIPLQHTDPFTLLIAVLLSAQCQDARVNKVTPTLFQLAATPSSMAQQTVTAIQEIIRPCGLSHTKARHIVELSSIIESVHDGQVPDTFHALEQLPGVGHKTASVIMAQAFNKPAFPVDTHIIRLANRWNITNSRNPLIVEKALKELFPKKYWIELHLQMIYYGRTYCPARKHSLDHCPICSWVQTHENA